MISQQDAEALYQAYERALGALDEAEALLWNIPEGPARDKLLHAHSDVTVDMLSRLRAPLVLQFPELDTGTPNGVPSTLLEPDEQDAVSRLTAAQTREIDEFLLAACAPSWKKVASVVGMASTRGANQFADIPYGYFVQRVKVLVEAGQLESQGNLDHMRHSEVRLPGN
ncbi:DUF3658 domain-containing protein [Variovorax sp. LT1R20]|uniref:DUF3658 domain-containing protein n=1 Tax=Variovorax sp. LT1R20 TaxID=3443729 RepID=UPI003F46AA42